MKYLVNFGTGAGNQWVNSIDEAKEYAVENATYTQCSIWIEDEKGNELYKLPWWGVQPGDDDEVVKDFGSFGFYGEWIELA